VVIGLLKDDYGGGIYTS